MISRNKEKVDAKLAEVKTKFPSTETVGIKCDFGQLTSMAEYRELVESSELKDMDIGILCLNAGTFYSGPIDKIDDKPFENVFNCTGLHCIYLCKALVKKMLERDKRCALLITSSIAA